MLTSIIHLILSSVVNQSWMNVPELSTIDLIYLPDPTLSEVTIALLMLVVFRLNHSLIDSEVHFTNL